MKSPDFNRDESSEFKWNSGFESNESQKTTSEPNIQAKDLLSSHLQENITYPKVDFDKFISDFPAPLYYFAQNKKTSQFIDEEDVKSILEAKKTRDSHRSKVISATVGLNITVMKSLNDSNKIFGLTYRRSVPGVLIKYYIIPVVARKIFDSLFFYPTYRQTSHQIQSKYSFQDPLFMSEYEQDPDPIEAIRLYLQGRKQKAVELSPNENVTDEANDLKK